MDKTRIPDYKEVEKGLKDSDPNIRNAARGAEKRLKAEMYDGRIQEMRSRMVEETRRGRNDNANSIREDVQNHTKRGFGRTSFVFTGLDEIFGDKNTV